MRKLLILILLTISLQNAFSCDICGCSSGNYFIGPFPQFNKYFLGMRYSFRSFNTVLNSDNNQFSNDFYQTVELWGGLRLNKKWQLFMFAPYNINQSVSDEGKKQNNGLGDMTLIGNYNLFDKKYLTKDTQTVSQQLWIGAGVKLPTGKFSIDTSELVSSANSQSGTGSFDFLITATYTLVIEDWGLTSNIIYKINQTSSDFKFGNRFTATAFTFRAFQFKKYTLSPNIGLLYENLNPNELDKTKIASTGGSDLLAAIGLETRIDQFTIGFNAKLPLMQNISDSQTKIKLNGMVHLTYAF